MPDRLILQHRIYRADLRANPSILYVFGDNEERWGRGGQAAEMRDEPNAIGVATLKAPGVFWTEDDAVRQGAGRIVVFPLDGIGSGLADLERRSPTTWAHLQQRINELKSAGEA